MAVAGETPGRAFAATWRNEQGDVTGTTYAGTMCERPRKPWRIRFGRDGFEGTLPCGECSGCLEFQRKRLADRLHAKYGARGEELRKQSRSRPRPSPLTGGCLGTQLFTVRIWTSIDAPDPLQIVRRPVEKHLTRHLPDAQVRLSHKLHRRRGLELEPGMLRLGASSFALLTRERTRFAKVLRTLRLKHRIEPLRLSRGKRAWRPVTAGLTVAREIYGEQRNRFYVRGLPKAERQKWEVRKIGQYQSYDRNRSPRAWTERKLVLVPPEVWQLRRADRRALRGQLLRQPDPEGVARVMRMVSDAISSARTKFDVSAAPKARLTRDEVVKWYADSARRKEARTASAGSDSSNTPTSEVGGYVSSEHSQGELLPKMVNGAPAPTPDQRRDRRIKWEIYESLERLRKKITRGGEDV